MIAHSSKRCSANFLTVPNAKVEKSSGTYRATDSCFYNSFLANNHRSKVTAPNQG
jgi:hypothetical protein